MTSIAIPVDILPEGIGISKDGLNLKLESSSTDLSLAPHTVNDDMNDVIIYVQSFRRHVVGKTARYRSENNSSSAMPVYCCAWNYRNNSGTYYVD